MCSSTYRLARLSRAILSLLIPWVGLPAFAAHACAQALSSAGNTGTYLKWYNESEDPVSPDGQLTGSIPAGPGSKGLRALHLPKKVHNWSARVGFASSRLGFSSYKEGAGWPAGEAKLSGSDNIVILPTPIDDSNSRCSGPDIPGPAYPGGTGVPAERTALPTGQQRNGAPLYRGSFGQCVIEHHTTYLLRFYPDGTVSRYDHYLNSTHGGKLFRIKWTRDPFDNVTTYHYEAPQSGLGGKLLKIVHPASIEEHWNWSPSWVGTGFCGVEITYSNVDQAGHGTVNLADFTRGFLFKNGATGSVPFASDTRLYRIFWPKTPRLPEPVPANGLYGANPAGDVVTDHHVDEFQFTVVNGLTVLLSIHHRRMPSLSTGAASGGSAPFRAFEYDVSNARVKKVTNEHGEARDFAYSTLARTETDARGTAYEITYDAFGRTSELTVRPKDDASGRPRAYDPGNADLGACAAPEPSALTWRFIYASGFFRPSKVTSPTLREELFTYDFESGNIVSKALRNPSNVPGAAVWVSANYQWTWQNANGALDGTPSLLKEIVTPHLRWTAL